MAIKDYYAQAVTRGSSSTGAGTSSNSSGSSLDDIVKSYKTVDSTTKDSNYYNQLNQANKDIVSQLEQYKLANAGNVDYRYNDIYDYYSTLAQKSQAAYDDYVSLANENLSSKAQAYLMQAQAMKYANNSMNASGLGSQGVAESTRAGYANNYANQLSALDIARQDGQASISKTYQDALAEEGKTLNDNLAVTEANNADTAASVIDSVFARTNLTKEDLDETWEKYSGSLSSADKYLYQNKYDKLSNDIQLKELGATSIIPISDVTETFAGTDKYDVKLRDTISQMQDGDVIYVKKDWGDIAAGFYRKDGDSFAVLANEPSEYIEAGDLSSGLKETNTSEFSSSTGLSTSQISQLQEFAAKSNSNNIFVLIGNQPYKLNTKTGKYSTIGTVIYSAASNANKIEFK